MHDVREPSRGSVVIQQGDSSLESRERSTSEREVLDQA